jgi:hypothetical protein
MLTTAANTALLSAVTPTLRRWSDVSTSGPRQRTWLLTYSKMRLGVLESGSRTWRADTGLKKDASCAMHAQARALAPARAASGSLQARPTTSKSWMMHGPVARARGAEQVTRCATSHPHAPAAWACVSCCLPPVRFCKILISRRTCVSTNMRCAKLTTRTRARLSASASHVLQQARAPAPQPLPTFFFLTGYGPAADNARGADGIWVSGERNGYETTRRCGAQLQAPQPHCPTLRILMMHFSLFSVLMPSKTSLYFPRPTFRTTCATRARAPAVRTAEASCCRQKA